MLTNLAILILNHLTRTGISSNLLRQELKELFKVKYINAMDRFPDWIQTKIPLKLTGLYIMFKMTLIIWQ
jgi:hypothetical protein